MLKILIVDDDAEYGKLMSKTLSASFEPILAVGGKEALERILNEVFDIFLLDIAMPGVDGYEVCKSIRASEKNRDATIVFISAHDSVEDRLKTYQNGGDDFLAKPFELRELLAKLERAKEYTEEKKKLIDLSHSTREVAFQSMTEASDYGTIVHFARQTIKCETREELFKAGLKVLETLGLKSTIEFRGNQFEQRSHSMKPVSPIEVNLFELLRESGRLYHFDSRTIVNDKDVSILIKNMPIEDDARYGRMKDVLAFVVEILQEKFESLLQRERISNALIFSKALQMFIEEHFIADDSKVSVSLDVLNAALGELQEVFHILGLTEEQEKSLQSMIDTVIEELMKVTDMIRTLEPISTKVSDGLNRIK